MGGGSQCRERVKNQVPIDNSLSASGLVVAPGRNVVLVENNLSDDPTLAMAMGAIGLLVFSMFLVPLRDFLGAPNVAIVLLLGVQLLAITAGRRGGIVGAIVAALSFDFFFTEPYLELVITDRHDIITALLLLLTGVATSELTHLRVRSAQRGTRPAGQ